MKTILLIFIYHLFLVFLVSYLRFSGVLDGFVDLIWIDTALLGLVGGCTYCMRALYLQYCVKKEWDNRWIVWHIIRPFISIICGIVSFLFVKAGLLIFEASSIQTSSHYGIYALAFIAGLNIDNFLKKIEAIFKEFFGIKETKASGEK